MADLFTRLAERAQGQASTVEPRRPTLFELQPTPGGDTEFTSAAPVVAEPDRPRRHWPTPEAAPGDETGSTPPGEATAAVLLEPAQPPLPEPTATRPAITPVPDAVEPVSRVSNVERHAESRIRPLVSEPVVTMATQVNRERAAAQVAASPPAVHISIGRIEVRAAPPAPIQGSMPAPPAPQPAREEAGLSLAAYLRGDDGRPR